MSTTGKHLHRLVELGQKFREQGRQLDIARLRRAIERGEVPATRVGDRWFIEEEPARRFTRPLPGPEAV